MHPDSIETQINKILSKATQGARHIAVKYATTENKIETKEVDLLSAKALFPRSDWKVIHFESLRKFSSETRLFKCFFDESFEKINAKDLTIELISSNKSSLYSLDSELFILASGNQDN